MPVIDRKNVILDILEHRGTASYEELSALLGVSSMTVRRDCEELSKRREVLKTVGGVQSATAPASLYETAVLERISANRIEKRTIAAKALGLITTQQTVFIDGGTTTLELAKLIAKERTGLTIVTNSALTCLEMSQSQNTIIGIGGEYEAANLSFVGPQAEDYAKSFFVDIAFISTKGFQPTEGIYESSMGTFRIKQIMAQQAMEVVLLVDHTKFGQRALTKVLEVSQIHHVVTDAKASERDIGILTGQGCSVHIAKPRKLEGLSDAA